MVHCYIVYYLLINGKAIRGMGGSIDGKEENGGAQLDYYKNLTGDTNLDRLQLTPM